MRRPSAAIAVALAGALGTAAAATAQERVAALPDPNAPLTPAPPLRSDAEPLLTAAYTAGTRSTEEVRVALRADGTPHSVQVLQRLELVGSGDYAFIVPAPLLDVRPGPGTESQPGFRRGAIVWQGFSPGRRKLAAVAVLEPAAALRSLPLRVSVRATRGELELAIENVTATSAVSFAGRGDPVQLARVLDEARHRLAARGPFLPQLVRAEGVRARTYRVDVAFRLSGTVRLGRGRFRSVRASAGRAESRGSTLRFVATLGGREPSGLVVRARIGSGTAPRLELRAEPLRDVPGLRPPRGASWTAALEDGLVPRDGRRLLTTTVETFLRMARLAQYETFLRNPSPSAGIGQARASYVYRTVAAAPAAKPADDGSGGAVATVLLAFAVVAAVGVATVVWAHS